MPFNKFIDDLSNFDIMSFLIWYDQVSFAKKLQVKA